MAINVRIKDLTDYKQETANLNLSPNECPHCHHRIDPVYEFGIIKAGPNHRKAECVFRCTHQNCQQLMIAYYDHEHMAKQWIFVLKKTSTGAVRPPEFDNEIKDVSPSYVQIFTEAAHAEALGLTEICGGGYRKALEFLIKDYLIGQINDDGLLTNIREKLLGQCIKDHVSDPKIKQVAKHAAWLGNDHVHYMKKWADKDIDDLKVLIKLAVHWILAEKLTEKYNKEMGNS